MVQAHYKQTGVIFTAMAYVIGCLCLIWAVCLYLVINEFVSESVLPFVFFPLLILIHMFLSYQPYCPYYYGR